MMTRKAKKIKQLVAQESTYTFSRKDQYLSDIFMLAGVAMILSYLSYISL